MRDLPAGEVSPEAICATADRAARAIPPLWPLSSAVAVNPYLGQAGLRLAEAGAELARMAGTGATMPRRWYLERIAAGRITEADLEAARAAAPYRDKPDTVPALIAAARADGPARRAIPTLADLAGDAGGTDWPALIAERFGHWAAARFDEGQALWAMPARRGPYAAWRAMATHDLVPEINGLTGFCAHVAETPQTADAAIQRASTRLALPEAALESCFRRLLTTLGGWAQYARHRHWQAEQRGEHEPIMRELLAIRLVWEEALLGAFGTAVAAGWAEARAAHATPAVPDADLVLDEILQSAAERADERDLAGTLDRAASARTRPGNGARPALQAAFCIDVRSEVIRRALESLDAGIETIGFAGFFGLATRHRGFASDVAEDRLPVLLTPALGSVAGGPETREADTDARLVARARRAWGRFKLAAVSSFAFVEAMGPIYVAKLVRDGLGLDGGLPAAEPAPRLDPAPATNERVATAESVLRAMSLTGPFARVVLLAGHGAAVTNNPHLGALQCGACGGHSGEVNARLLAQLLNEAEVRAGLAERGIEIPPDTLFLAALHDTVSDRITLYDGDVDTSAHREDIAALRRRLREAGRIAAGERALALPRADDPDSAARRGRDWAETRPEWGLAGCRAFIAAPRAQMAGAGLGGRAFLHDYDWRRDEGFGVLELILTAPVVVASWISLQYYGSTVSPELFGAGNKLLHNVTGGIGVVEGNGGVLRPGLPWQSVHDGAALRHEALRLAVCIAAPRTAIDDILSRHDGVRALVENGWLRLFTLDDAGRLAWRHAGVGAWEAMAPADPRPAEPSPAGA